VLRDPDSTPHHAATGTQSAILANGLSHWLGVHGPSMTIETGCSSSLIAVHQACQSLRTYESDIVSSPLYCIASPRM
jgi:acyl transferase domain-containing protein